LGRGLAALIGEVKVDQAPAERPKGQRRIPIAFIRPNPRNPRRAYDDGDLADLAQSIREKGVLQPLVVRPLPGADIYEIIAGERRWRAAKRANLATISVIVRTADDLASLEQAVVENLHRQDLNPLEEAAAYQQLIEDFRLTHDQLAARVGKSRVTVTNMLRLFQLPPSIQKLVAEGALGGGHARALLGTPDRAFQEALARRAVAESLSVRVVEEAVRARGEGEGASTPTERAPRLRQAGMHELEALLSEHLATRVKVNEGRKGGKVVVEFADLDDLERIYRAMTEAAMATVDGEVAPSS
jgi:ParB family chromosome partitioning protein